MSDTKVAVGTLEGITEKPTGWTDIMVLFQGRDNATKLSTKKQELVELARAAGSTPMQWTFTEKDSGNPNPHRPGSNYLNRYFEGVAPVEANGSTTQTAASYVQQNRIDAGSNEMSKEEWARKDSAIHKMACIKTAADALKHTLPSDPSDDDLGAFLRRVHALSSAWHRAVLAERDDPTGELVPF